MRLINADALIDYLQIIPIDLGYREVDDITEYVKHMPTIEPERKKGKWILVNGKTSVNCSYCYHCSWSLSFEDTVRQFNFCPNCGAKMEVTE